MNNLFVEKKNCRICGSANLSSILDFGPIALTGVFSDDGLSVPRAPLNFGICDDCNLAQTLHSYDLNALYTESYGYESGLNRSMTNHLLTKARMLEMKYLGSENSVVVEIASNDGTLLNGFNSDLHTLIGIDPLIDVVSDRYPENAIKVKAFFNEESYRAVEQRPADLVISNSVFYDLDDPIEFAKGVSQILKVGGVWHFEQSYLPSMVESLSYDTICHEHLLYLSLNDIISLLQRVEMQIIDLSLNEINGGSISITAIKSKKIIVRRPFVEFLIQNELNSGYTSGQKMDEFAKSSIRHVKELSNLIEALIESGHVLYGLGASTKGNLLLQALNIEHKWIKAIGDVNPRKFGKKTPGSNISICSEADIIDAELKNTVALVLPWHFKSGIVDKSTSYISSGNSLLFPLPKIQIYGC